MSKPSELANDPEFRKVADIFLDNLPEHIQKLTDAVKCDDLDQLKYLIYSIKGGGGGAGFPAITEKAAETEQLILNGELDSLKTLVDELAQLCRGATAGEKGGHGTFVSS